MFVQIMISCLSALLALIHKCFWFAHVSSLESKGCAHAHTHTRARTNDDFNLVAWLSFYNHQT